MEVIFIDANIFLEILLDDDNAQSCIDFLESMRDEDASIVTTDFIIYTCFIQIERNLKGSKPIKETIFFFNSIANLNVLRPTIADIDAAAKIMDAYKLDFDDSLIVACMRRNGIERLASLDKHFNKVKDIQRIKF